MQTMMTVKELKQILDDVPDDFIIMVRVRPSGAIDGSEFWTTSLFGSEVDINKDTHTVNMLTQSPDWL